MNEKIKNILNVAIILGILAAAYASVSYVVSYSKSIAPSTFRSFSVSGEGKIVAIPDVAQISFGLITQGGKNIAAIQNENSGKVNAMIEFLKSQNVDKKDIKTQNYSLEPRYQYFSCPMPQSSVKPCPPPEIVGYTVSQTIQVKIRDFSKIGDILSGVVQKGANNVSQLSFQVDDPEKIKSQARTEAIKQAKEKAEAIAEAAGFKMGQLLSIDESGFVPQGIYRTYGLGAAEIKAGAIAPSIEPGSQEITINVTLKYEIR
ncbi:SIMPL domain-containing protein [Candidatus Wolfebacteria bacterium]|nr:SIMPL domain-containing protein [Candidatus Wolfebacteria bacterium]